MEFAKHETFLTPDSITKSSAVQLTFSKQPPEWVEPGAFFTLRVRAVCKDMPRLEGLMVSILDHQGNLLRKLRLMVAYPRSSDTDQVVFQAPKEAGEYTWTALFTDQRLQDTLYQEARAEFTFSVPQSHSTSLSVWNIPNVVITGNTFTPRVGLKCSAGCSLAGQRVQVFDDHDNLSAQVCLGDTASGASGTVYWADVPITVDLPGKYRYTARFTPEEGDVHHQPASCEIAFRAEPQGICRVRVAVATERDELPVEGATVFLRPYYAKTDSEGIASLIVPKGKFRLIVTGQEQHNIYGKNVSISEDTGLQVLLEDSPPPPDGIG